MKDRPKFATVSEEMKQWSALLGKELSSWSAVSARRMFGMMAYYCNDKIFAALPRTKAFETPNSVAFKLYKPTARAAKLLSSDSRITRSKGKAAGWIAFEVNAPDDLKDALKWFDLAYRNCLSKNNSTN